MKLPEEERRASSTSDVTSIGSTALEDVPAEKVVEFLGLLAD